MKALSIQQPWVWAILEKGKRLENRTWKPPWSVIGQRIALHASKMPDKAGYAVLAERLGEFVGGQPRGAILGTAIVASSCERAEAFRLHGIQARDWWAGPVAWVLRDVQQLPEPIPCRGHLGLWEVPEEIVRRIEASLRER